MKIHIVNTFYPPWRGGAETYTRSLAENLARLGHEVKVTAAHPPTAPGRYSYGEVTVTRLRSIGFFYGVPLTPRLIQDLIATDADILHVNFPNPYNAAVGALASRISGVPAVLTWHNDLPPVTRLAGVIAQVHDRLIAPLYLDWYDAIIATTKIYVEDSKPLKKYRKKIHTIMNGVDCERFRPDIYAGDLKNELNLKDSKTVLFVGALTRWHRYKGLDDLLLAFRSLNRPDVRLLVVGGGDLKHMYEQMAQNLRIRDRVVFTGEVPDTLLPKYYAISDVLALPSKDRSEGFGLTILEANASGIPAIASAVGGVPGILIDGENGVLVPPKDPKTLAEAIRRLVDDDDYRAALGRKARELALKHDWRIVASDTERLYLEVIRGRASVRESR
ncbi:glycosyltransferase family 4 protein [Candidatus Bathyarchaeota archaeon]|nr:glycosyltransferase family 4 protein [Candidatus Bathyarchaeota archaeon]